FGVLWMLFAECLALRLVGFDPLGIPRLRGPCIGQRGSFGFLHTVDGFRGIPFPGYHDRILDTAVADVVIEAVRALLLWRADVAVFVLPDLHGPRLFVVGGDQAAFGVEVTR